MSRLPAQHKRKGSALDQQDDGQDPASGKAARPSGAEAQHEEPADKEEHEAKVRAAAKRASYSIP